MTAPTVAAHPAKEDARQKFQRLASEWKARSRYLSNTAQKAMLTPYQQIIGMGEPAIPLILEDLGRELNHWFWALEMITGDDPVPQGDAGRVRKMADAWLEWGKQHGYVSS